MLLFCFKRFRRRHLLKIQPGAYERAKSYPSVVIFVEVLAIMRVMAITILLLPSKTNPGVKASQSIQALSVACLVVAILDWIPFRLMLWQREPSILAEWSISAVSTLSMAINVAFVGVGYQSDGSEKYTAMTGLILSVIVAIAVNSKSHHFVYNRVSGPYFVNYKPVAFDSKPDSSTEGTDGPCARLFQSQQSFGGYGQMLDGTEEISEISQESDAATVQTSVVKFHPAHFYWLTPSATIWLSLYWPYLILCSSIHLVVQVIRLKRSSDSNRTSALDIIYPLLWFVHVAIMCTIIKYRIDLRKKILFRQIPLYSLPYISGFAIFGFWILDLALTKPESPLFGTDNRLGWWQIGTGFMFVTWGFVSFILWRVWGSLLWFEAKYGRAAQQII